MEFLFFLLFCAAFGALIYMKKTDTKPAELVEKVKALFKKDD